jgi:hypothetical protein
VPLAAAANPLNQRTQSVVRGRGRGVDAGGVAVDARDAGVHVLTRGFLEDLHDDVTVEVVREVELRGATVTEQHGEASRREGAGLELQRRDDALIVGSGVGLGLIGDLRDATGGFGGLRRADIHRNPDDVVRAEHAIDLRLPKPLTGIRAFVNGHERALEFIEAAGVGCSSGDSSGTVPDVQTVLSLGGLRSSQKAITGDHDDAVNVRTGRCKVDVALRADANVVFSGLSFDERLELREWNSVARTDGVGHVDDAAGVL